MQRSKVGAQILVELVLSGAPRLHIADLSLAYGDSLSGLYGFDECCLDEELLRIILALALRKQEDPMAWTSADELGVLARGGASGASTAKRLEVVLAARPRVEAGPRLIEYWQSQPEGRYRGGRSRGPYRLGRWIDSSRIDMATALALLTGGTGLSGATCAPDDYAELSLVAKVAFGQGDFVAARRFAGAMMAAIYSQPTNVSSKELMATIAEAQTLFANIALELGQTSQGLTAALTAQRLFTRLRHVSGLTRALQVEAHMRGQMTGEEEAALSVAAAKRALFQLDNGSRSSRKGLSRAMVVGTIGWRLNAAGRLNHAGRRLRSALRMSQDAGSEEWSGVWSFRAAQNEVARGNLRCAEEHLQRSLTLKHSMGVSTSAAMARAATEFFIATGDFDEAERWLRRAQIIGHNNCMAYQTYLVERLASQLQDARVAR